MCEVILAFVVSRHLVLLAHMQSVLLSVHTFFDALGGEEIRKRGAREDKPLRMVKTVLHELCKLKVRGVRRPGKPYRACEFWGKQWCWKERMREPCWKRWEAQSGSSCQPGEPLPWRSHAWVPLQNSAAPPKNLT